MIIERCVQHLHNLLARLPTERSFDERVEWLEDLASWLFTRGKVPGMRRGEPTASARLRMLLDFLELMPEVKGAVRAVLAEVFAGLSYVRLFTDTGLPSETGFMAEAWERVVKSVLPEAPVERCAAILLHRLYQDQRSADWFDNLEPTLRHRLFESLAVPCGPALEPALQSMRDATVLLAIRIADTGTADDVRERCGETTLDKSAFLQLPMLVDRLVRGHEPKPGEADPGVAAREGVAACRRVLVSVRASLEESGISLSLVYRLEYLRHLLDRLYSLLVLLAPATGTVMEGAGFHLLQVLIRGGVDDRSVLQLCRTNNRLLARRVIERVGQTGEHYITRTRAELHQMVASAAGGGALTAGAVVLKLAIAAAHLPVLVEAAMIGANYSGAFVSMQLCGFTLATKQPSMTAAALAHSIKQTGETSDLSPLVDQVVRTVRSQIAAILGNLGMVIPVSVGIDLAWRGLTGRHILDAAYSEVLLEHHHPLTSGTILFAALTGVYLWLASVMGGMVENWFVVQRLPDAIRTNRSLRATIGRGRASRLSNWATANIAGLGGNVGFAMILALVPMLATTLGLTVEVRHVTFVTGLLTFAAMERGPLHLLEPSFLWALSSVGIVGLLNFMVSFTLALFVAFGARDVRPHDQVQLLWEVLIHIARHPMDCFRAPASDEDPSLPPPSPAS